MQTRCDTTGRNFFFLSLLPIRADLRKDQIIVGVPFCGGIFCSSGPVSGSGCRMGAIISFRGLR